MRNVHALTGVEIDKVYKGFREKSAAMNREFALAVTDSHGELVFFIKTDNCPQSAVSIAVNKAFTAARDRQKTSSLANASAEFGFSITSLGDTRYTDLGGGVPFAAGGKDIGAVGVSGMTQEEDETMAEELIRFMML